MIFGRAHPKVEALAHIPADDLPWRHEGVLVLVSKGLGALRWRGVKADGVTKRALMLRDTPLLFAQSDEYWCPTCEKLLALGWGRDQVDDETLALVRNASNDVEAPIDALVDRIQPVLQLLQEGVYLVSRVPHSPTNGAGETFWGLSTELRPLEASKDWYFADLGLFELAQGYPAFLLPTQSPEQCNRDRVDQYRKLAAQGQTLGGLAFWVDGFLSALLDGHHRATAALLENTPVTCLTIMSPTGVEIGDKEKLLRLWDARVPYSNLPKHAVRVLEKQHRAEAADIAVAVERAATGPTLKDATGCDWAAMTAAAAAFPTAQGLAACSVAGDMSEQRIDELIAGGESSAPQLWAILQALIASRDPRATALALRVGEGHWPDLWKDAFRYLSTVRTEQVEDFFIQFLIRDEGLHPWLGDIANDYLARATGGRRMTFRHCRYRRTHRRRGGRGRAVHVGRPRAHLRRLARAATAQGVRRRSCIPMAGVRRRRHSRRRCL